MDDGSGASFGAGVIRPIWRLAKCLSPAIDAPMLVDEGTGALAQGRFAQLWLLYVVTSLLLRCSSLLRTDSLRFISLR